VPTPLVVPPARPVFPASDRTELARLIDAALTTGALTLGPVTERFEQAFAARHSTKHAVAVSSGTAALEIILRSIGVEGRTVVVPANTFFATAAAVLHAGGEPRFADISPTSLALSAETVADAIDDRCSAVLLVHIGGVVTPEIDEIAQLCEARGVTLLEDAAHAHGAGFDGRPAGTFGAAAAFSFYPTKVMTSGEGGMIVTDDDELAAEARIYRDQGKAGFLGGDHVRLGYAWRMSELHAAVGDLQLARLDDFLTTRRSAAHRYDAGLTGLEAIAPVPIDPRCEPNFYKYIAMLAPGIDRAAFKQQLRDEHGVGMSGEVYASPLHHQPVFASIPHGDLPVSEDICARQVCLPVHSDMTDAEADHVIAAVRQVAGERVGAAPALVTE
jgi:dTDP-4-amino-4,6-dideoxygalactose transaminase